MRTLKFNVGQQIIKKSGDFSNIASGSSGYLKCSFRLMKYFLNKGTGTVKQ